MMGWDKLDGRWQALSGRLLLEGKNKAMRGVSSLDIYVADLHPATD